MTELITGAKGTSHVTSAQQGAINAYTLGTGEYILNGCAATMPAANTLHIAAGHLMVQGRAVEVTATDLTISNGSQGMKRHDLVCMSYAFASNVESATLAVVQGTPSASPSDPTVTGSILNGDATAQIPLWRVTLDGITVGTPVLLLDRLPTLDSVSQTLWTNPSPTAAIGGVDVSLASNTCMYYDVLCRVDTNASIRALSIASDGESMNIADAVGTAVNSQFGSTDKTHLIPVTVIGRGHI